MDRHGASIAGIAGHATAPSSRTRLGLESLNHIWLGSILLPVTVDFCFGSVAAFVN